MAKATPSWYPASDQATLWRNLITAVGGNGPATDTAMGSLENAFALALYNQSGVTGGLSIAPSGTTGQTMSRAEGSESETIAVTSGDLYLAALSLPAGTVVNNLNFVVGSTGSTTVTHNWAVLTTSARVPVAVSADNTTTDLTNNTVASYAVATTAAGAAASYTVPTSGLYYIGFMIATSMTQPTMFGNTGAASTINAIAPIAGGLSNTGATTPPTSFVNALTAITASASVLYGYTT